MVLHFIFPFVRNTDFGNANTGGGNVVRTFTIQNAGTSNLTVSGITMSGTDAAMFTVGALTPASPIAASGSATFTVTFAPTSTGLKTATVNIANNDCDEASYDFAVQGTGTSAGPYYSKAAGNLHDVLTWGRNPDGSGANPPDFGADKTFNLANRPGIYTLTGDWTVGGQLVNPASSQLRINGFTLSIAAMSGGGTLTGSLTSNLIVTGTAGGNQPLNFTPGFGSLNNLTLNRTGTGASATIASALNIFNVLTTQNGILNTGNLLTLKSSATNTARVAPIPGTANISGNVIVERFIPARRAWRIMSAPVAGAQTINAAWQEGVTTASPNPNPNPGFGTHITQGSVANGFDQNPAGASVSIQKYNSATNTWVALSNTNATSVGADAYMLFVRGDRGIPLGNNTVPPTNTVLRATGPLKIGNQTFPVSVSGFTGIPNPFASPINFSTLTRINVQNNFYLWDPKMGGVNGVGAYVLLSFNGVGYDVTPASVSPESQYIQSGQGFLVRSTGVAGSLVIKESDKSATPATNVFRVADNTTNTSPGLRVNLQMANADNTTSLLDEVFSSYSTRFSNKVDDMDAVKMPNFNENLGIVKEGQTLMVERKSLITESDTIQLKVWNASQTSYLLEFNPANLSSTALSAFVEDKYLHTITPISISEISRVYFTVNSDAASARPDRFMVVLSSKTQQPVITGILGKGIITAYPNPTGGRNINLQFTNAARGMYQVQLVNSLGQVVFRKNMFHAGGSATQTLDLGKKPGEGIYQLQVTGADVRVALKIISN